MNDQRLVIVSNRGPAEFRLGPDGERVVQRGGGGLVTALSGSLPTAERFGSPRR